MIDKSSEAINSFYSYLRSVLENPDSIHISQLEEEAKNYLDRNPHVKDSIDFHSLVGGIKERIEVLQTFDFNFNQFLDDKIVDHIDWYDDYLKNKRNNRPYWQRYYNYALSTGLSSIVLKGIDDTTDKILSKCENPMREGKWQNKGLVVGVVQGGKTTHMMGLCNKAIDAGYKLIVVFPGILEDLRLQTHERFDLGVIGKDTQSNINLDISNFSHGVSKYNRKLKVYNFTSANKRGDSVNEIKNLQIEYDGPSILILKKNPTIIKHLIARIYRNENAFKKYPMLIIDDESDLATINTKNVHNIENVTQDELTSTPKFMRALISLFDKSAYIGYTATPYANIFQDYREAAEKESVLPIKWKDKHEGVKEEKKVFNLGEGLFPKNFICSLPIYSNYIGFEKMFGDEFFEDGNYTGNKSIETIEDYVDDDSYQLLKNYYENLQLDLTGKENPKPDKEDINGWLSPFHDSSWKPGQYHPLPNSLKEAIKYFVISNIIKKIRNIKPIHNSMLINVSRFVDTNESIRNQVLEYINEIKTHFGLGDQKNQIKNSFEEIWNNEFKYNLREDYIYPSRKIIWEEIEANIQDELEKIRVLLITGNNDYLEYTNNISKSIIAVGGTRLSRGITLEGLSVSYFLRKTDNPSADAVTQMGRWFGYRPRYDDICKLYINEFQLEDFRNYYEAEENLRNQFFNMEKKEMSPLEYGLVVPMKRPAAPNKTKQTQRNIVKRNFSAKRKQLIFVDINKNKKNMKTIKNLLNSISTKSLSFFENGRYWQNVDVENVISFLNDYISPIGASKSNEESYKRYINTVNSLGGNLKKWNIALLSNNSGKFVNKNSIGYEFVPLSRAYFPKNEKYKDALRNWDGDPTSLENFKGIERGIYRIKTLTEPSHFYIDMNISKHEADDLFEKEKIKNSSENKDLDHSKFWISRRNVPLLTIYPFKSPGDKENKNIYFSYSIIFPKSDVVNKYRNEFSDYWETINRVMIDQYKKFKNLSENI